MTEATKFAHRIGVDLGRRIALEEGIRWAAAHDIHYLDCQIDIDPNPFESFLDERRCAAIRRACEDADVHIGLHTLSAVNIAEISPFLRDAADAYLRGYIDAAKRLDAKWVEVHAGYHFTADKTLRMTAGLERLKRAVGYAEEQGIVLQLESMNWEPDLAEVHYLGHNVEECLYYFDAIDSAHLKWAFTINHATLVPEGINGFLGAMPTERLGAVRVADNNGEYELHMFPGTGIINFTEMFRSIEATGYAGHYMSGYGSLDDMLRGRDYLVARYQEIEASED